MLDIITGAGLLIYPLGLCSVIAVFIICERLYALRRAAILPDDLVDAVLQGKETPGGKHSVLARVLGYAADHRFSFQPPGAARAAPVPARAPVPAPSSAPRAVSLFLT